MKVGKALQSRSRRVLNVSKFLIKPSHTAMVTTTRMISRTASKRTFPLMMIKLSTMTRVLVPAAKA